MYFYTEIRYFDMKVLLFNLMSITFLYISHVKFLYYTVF